MKYGFVIKLLMVACVSIVQLTGCSSDTEELEKSVSGIPIRIVAEMNGGTGISQMTKAAVRSSGEWKENYIGAEEYEKTVKHVLLFAFSCYLPISSAFSAILFAILSAVTLASYARLAAIKSTISSALFTFGIIT